MREITKGQQRDFCRTGNISLFDCGGGNKSLNGALIICALFLYVCYTLIMIFISVLRKKSP